MAAKKPKAKKKIRVAHELPRKRKNAIQEAMAAHKLEDRPEWDRTAKWTSTRFYRKIIKPGQLRTVEMPLLNVSLGDKWPISVTIIHGKRPGPVVTILGAIHGDELTGT
ncbi:MAG: hypothetical protein CL988_04905, partial [Euryarchaeota archaeon]|nr:hypothetical protein [Euryarchaeota archaeon]